MFPVTSDELIPADDVCGVIEARDSTTPDFSRPG
jgi:hypothetical protein